MIYDPREGGAALERAMERLQAQASAAVRDGNTILILSDRGVTEKCAPIPSLLATAGVHHHLVREGTRTRCALLLESGDAREVHHVALLIGYGAGAVNPYLAFETLDDMIAQGMVEGVSREKATLNYIKALNKGILKVMSKMGISTLQSYCGAQIFEAIGLEQAFVDRYFTWTASRIGGVGIDVIAREVKERHERAFPARRPRARRPRVRRRVPLAARRRAAPVQPRDGAEAAARDAHAASTPSTATSRRSSTTRAARSARCAGCSISRATGRRSRSTRSSRPKRSSSASRPARCRTARSARKRTRRLPSP